MIGGNRVNSSFTQGFESQQGIRNAKEKKLTFPACNMIGRLLPLKKKKKKKGASIACKKNGFFSLTRKKGRERSEREIRYIIL